MNKPIFVGTIKPGQDWYTTEIIAVPPKVMVEFCGFMPSKPKDLPTKGIHRAYEGPCVPGISFEDAQRYCYEHLGYCRVVGRLNGYRTLGGEYKDLDTPKLN